MKLTKEQIEWWRNNLKMSCGHLPSGVDAL